ncbi:MAG TPA: hypothetical protein P5293_06590 [Bacteroidales bacterium]|nr:hypothetical protein [Bacteroidales bacterium]
MRLPTNIKKKINRKISDLTKVTHKSIPLGIIDSFLRENGFFLIQEDGQPWSGFLLGENSQATIDIGSENDIVTNAVLVISWYRYSITGRYEIVAYIS